jgi:hypothetical protein
LSFFQKKKFKEKITGERKLKKISKYSGIFILQNENFKIKQLLKIENLNLP